MIAVDIRNALSAELRWLFTTRGTSTADAHKLQGPSGQGNKNRDGEWLGDPLYPPMIRDRKLAERLLRIEIGHDTIRDLMMEQGSDFYWLRQEWSDHQTQGRPFRFMGIDVYEIHGVPAPGWRILNPFRKEWPR